ncbi:MAG: amino acid ABC transporter permease [Pirellulaceae bacterium]|nr:MAG: amino acid ABC transporter permease [Pirellulaceae bacterium]
MRRVAQAVNRSWWLAVLVLAVACPKGHADQWDELQQRGVLRWGGDEEGGGPYVYPDPSDPSRRVGFEVELADLLARRLGLRAEFCQGQWDRLPDLLQRGDIDIVLNGYEWTPVWAERFGTTIPYYIYDLQLLARRSDSSIESWEDLRRGPRKRVAVLGGSAAQAYMEKHFAGDVELVLYEGVTDAMRAVELGTDGLDATVQDGPIVTFYLERGFPGLKRVGQPVGRGFYTILVRKGERRLLERLNQAILDSLRDGSLRAILERYGLWDENQQLRALECDAGGSFRPGSVSADGAQQATETFTAVRGKRVLAERGWLLVKAAGVTVVLSVLAMPLAIAMGLLVAVTRLFTPRWLSWLAVAYIEIVRGTPLVLQLYVIFFVLPELGIHVSAFWAAILGLAINYSAYEAEIYRAGIQAIPAGQMEAALSLGMSKWLALRRIIIPQATRIVIPPMTNDFIALFKDTAVCSVITVVELSKEYYIHARSTGAVVELGILTALLYLAMSYPLAVLTRRMEKRMKGERHV